MHRATQAQKERPCSPDEPCWPSRPRRRWPCRRGPRDDRMKVVTTFTVLADMAQNVAGDAAEVVSITKPGAEIHGYEPTPQDIVRAQDADLILWNGLGLERWFEQFLDNLGDVPSVTLTDGIEPMPIADGAYEGKPNPHAWMGARERADLRRQHRRRLRRARPRERRRPTWPTPRPTRPRSARRSSRFATGSPRLPEERRWLVTCEGAFSYLARDFGMKELYLWPINADQIGHAAAGAQGHRRGARARHPGGLLREHRQHRPGRAGGARDRRGASAGSSTSTA